MKTQMPIWIGFMTFIAPMLVVPLSASAVPCSKTINTYKYPIGPKYFQCCTPKPEQVFEGNFGGGQSSGASRQLHMQPDSTKATKGSNARASSKVAEPVCEDISRLSPLAIYLRAKNPIRKHCGPPFPVYDHFTCTCQSSCSVNPNIPEWTCTCPNVPYGQQPIIHPQDSLGSQIELINSVQVPCNSASTCDGNLGSPGNGGQRPQFPK